LTFPALDDIMKLTHANDATGGRLQIGIPGRLRIGMHGRLRRNPQPARPHSFEVVDSVVAAISVLVVWGVLRSGIHVQ
jgi:hypothetical protein